VQLADEGGDGRGRAEKRERDYPRGLGERLAGDDLRELGNEDDVDGDHPDRQNHERRVGQRLRIADDAGPPWSTSVPNA